MPIDKRTYYWQTRIKLYKKNLSSLKRNTLLKRSAIDLWPDLPVSTTVYIAMEQGNPAIEIHINDKFAENGYSDHLLPEYQGYGYAKLTLMMQLPDAINEGLTPGYSNGSKGLRSEMIVIFKEYLMQQYPDWNEDELRYKKWDFPTFG